MESRTDTTLTPIEAALYLGQKVQRHNARLDKTLTGSIHGVSPTFLQVQYGLTVARVEYHEVQLLLRPLADITEEEAKELYIMNFSERVTSKGFSYLKDYLNDKDDWYATNLYHMIGEPTNWQYLLSRGFDLFGFIEQGKALDKTKLAKLPASTDQMV